MESFSFSTCISLAVLVIFVQQLVCLPFVKDAKNSARLKVATGNDSALHLGAEKKMNGTFHVQRLLTYDDLPDDGSLDDEFRRQHIQEAEGM